MCWILPLLDHVVISGGIVVQEATKLQHELADMTGAIICDLKVCLMPWLGEWQVEGWDGRCSQPPATSSTQAVHETTVSSIYLVSHLDSMVQSTLFRQMLATTSKQKKAVLFHRAYHCLSPNMLVPASPTGITSNRSCLRVYSPPQNTRTFAHSYGLRKSTSTILRT